MSTGCAFRAVDVASLAWRARVATGAAVDAPFVLHQPYLATSLKVVHAGVPRPRSEVHLACAVTPVCIFPG